MSCVWFRAKFPRNVFMPLFLPFDFHGKPVLGTSTISYSFGCKYSPVMDFRGLNSTEKTPPSRPFSPILPGYFLALQNLGSKFISTRAIFLRPCSVETCEWLGSLRRFTKASVRIHLAQLKWREVIRWRSLRNPYVATFDGPMTDGCQWTKDFLAWQNFYSLQS